MSLTKATYSMISGAVVNVLDFGAVGDYNRTSGAGTDSTAAILAALSYAQNQPAGTGRGIVYFPEGNYKVTSTLSIANVSLMGAGAQASILNYTGSAALIYCAGGGNFIENLGLYGSNSVVSSIGVSHYGTLRHRMVGCNIFSFNRGVQLQGIACYGLSFQNNYFAANTIHVYAEAIGSGQFPTTCWFTENEFITGGSSVSPAIYLIDSDGFTFERNVIQGNGALHTIYINYLSGNGNAYANHRIINNWFEENSQSQVGSSNIRVQGNFGAIRGVLIKDNQFYTSFADNPTYCVFAENTDGLTVTDNFWNLGAPPWIFLYKSGVGNKNWKVDNPLVSATQNMNKHLAIVSLSTAQSIVAGATTQLLLNTTLVNDSGLWDTANYWFLCAAKGTYRVNMNTTFLSSIVGAQFNILAYLNGAPITLNLTSVCVKQTTGVENFSFTGYVTCVVGDKISFLCNNTGATDRSITTASQYQVELVNMQI